jgi:threonyl-tRNA synthetase
VHRLLASARAALYHALEELIRELNARYGYEEVRSPLTGDHSVWERSGHAGKARRQDGHRRRRGPPSGSEAHELPWARGAVRPPARSYRELPLRIAQRGHVDRAEQSGELNGLLRARAFVIDDAHVFCRADQVADELVRCLEMVRRVWEPLGAR